MERDLSKIRLITWTLWLCIGLGILPSVFASEASHARFGQLDPVLAQLLRTASSPGEKVTPLRVLRWISSEWNDTPMNPRSPAVEFQPIVHKHNSVYQIVATLAYTF